MRRLIVTADDLGLHRGMTDGAIQAHEQGIVTAASVSACGREVDHAIEALGGLDSLDVGIHFTLVEERPVLPAGELKSLTTREGRFHPSYGALAARWMTGRIDLDEVEAELRAQASLLTGAGLRLVHANGHQHLHVLPGIVGRVVAVSRSFGIEYLRSPRDVWRGAPRFGARVASMKVLRALGSRARRIARAAGLVSNDRTIGIANAGHQNGPAIAGLLPLVDGLTELVTHPGTSGPEIARAYDWGYEWDAETAALCDRTLLEAIADRGIELAKPSDVA